MAFLLKPEKVLQFNTMDTTKPFRCQQCNKDYNNQISLGKHMNIHSKLFVCLICQTPFRTSGNLKKHSEVAHIKNSAIHSCSFCHVRFSVPMALKNHQKRVHPNEMHTQEVLNNTQQQVTCRFCNKTYNNQSSLSTHMNIHLNPHVCSICKTPFTALADLKQHSKVHDSRAIHSCPFCHVKFSDNLSLNNHKRKVHPMEQKTEHSNGDNTEDQQVECLLCNKIFKNQTSLRVHKNIHSKAYVCSICKTPFVSSKDLKKHISSAHTNNPKLSCQDCHVKFNGALSLINHRKKVHLINAIKTTQEELFSQNSDDISQTDKIFLTHQEVKSETSNGTDEQNQVLISSKPKSDANSVIKKRKRKKKLHKFRLERPYVCRICKRAFCRAKHLQNHMSIHMNNPKFHCKDCGAKFYTGRAFFFHKRKQHQDKTLVNQRITSCFLPANKSSEKPLINEEFEIKHSVHIRQSSSEDPHLWPKVVLSKELNTLLLSQLCASYSPINSF